PGHGLFLRALASKEASQDTDSPSCFTGYCPLLPTSLANNSPFRLLSCLLQHTHPTLQAARSSYPPIRRKKKIINQKNIKASPSCFSCSTGNHSSLCCYHPFLPLFFFFFTLISKRQLRS
ncbi:hypothetical protein H112_08268, partial [Trichophyton rubrum D6]